VAHPVIGRFACLSRGEIVMFLSRYVLQQRSMVARRSLSSSRPEPTGVMRILKDTRFITLCIVGGFVAFIYKYRVEEFSDDWHEKLEASSIVQSVSNKEYIVRKDLQSMIQAAAAPVPLRNYTIVYGGKGVGKSELVCGSLRGKPGVVRLKVDVDEQRSRILPKLKWELTGHADYWSSRSFNSSLENCKIPPTIIFDCSSNDGTVAHAGSNIKLACGYAREFMKNKRNCNCIVIAEDSAPAMSPVPSYDPFQNFIFVSELDAAQAAEYLRKRRCELSEKELKFVTETVGTNFEILNRLTELVPGTMALDKFVQSVLSSAKEDLRSFDQQRVIAALKSNADGAAAESLKKLTTVVMVQVPARDTSVDTAMGPRRPILYRAELGVYQFASTAHRVASKDYEPQEYPLKY
jgi:hypothetical protein